jgi:hypothetical protein
MSSTPFQGVGCVDSFLPSVCVLDAVIAAVAVAFVFVVGCFIVVMVVVVVVLGDVIGVVAIASV